MKVAIVDIGASSLALVLATLGEEGSISLLGEWALETELASDFEGGGPDRVLAGLRSFRHILRMQHTETRVRAFASAALPEGSARDQLLRGAQGILDQAVEVLSLPEEGALAFLASHDAIAVPPGAAVITAEVDGANTYLAVGDGDRLEEVFTLGLGASSLTARFLAEGGGAEAGLALSEHLHELMNVDAVRRAVGERPFHVVASGSAVALLAALAADRLPERGALHGSPLTLETAFEWYQGLVSTPAGEIPERLGVPANRTRTLVAGAGILVFLMEKLERTEVFVSDNARRHGALREMLGLERAFL